jgi:predicted aspartyl protease
VPLLTSVVANLEGTGPVIQVLIGPSQALVAALQRGNQPIPQSIAVQAMVDTGASGTVITPNIARLLGLNPIGTAPMLTPSSQSGQPPHVAQIYDVSIIFQPATVVLPSIRVMEAPLGGQTIQCLIGRNILKLGMLVYTGYLGQFTLPFSILVSMAGTCELGHGAGHPRHRLHGLRRCQLQWRH